MREKQNAVTAPPAAGETLKNRIRVDLEQMGVAPQISESVAGRLEAGVAGLSPREYSAVLGVVATAYAERGGEPGIHPEDIADVQRLMRGFSEEVQKLDEGLRMLSAYVSRLRKRGPRSTLDTLH